MANAFHCQHRKPLEEKYMNTPYKLCVGVAKRVCDDEQSNDRKMLLQKKECPEPGDDYWPANA